MPFDLDARPFAFGLGPLAGDGGVVVARLTGRRATRKRAGGLAKGAAMMGGRRPATSNKTLLGDTSFDQENA